MTTEEKQNPWGRAGLAASGILLVLGLGGLRLLGNLLSSKGGLGVDGSQVVRSIESVLLLDGLWLLVFAALLLDLGGLRRRVEQRIGPAWHHTVAASLYAVTAVSLLLLAKVAQDNTVHGEMIGQFFRAGTIFGRPVVLPVEPFSIADYSTSVLLLIAGALAFAGAVAALRAPREGRLLPAPLSALMGAGLSYAGLDEYFTIHEFLGANTPVLKDVTFVHYPDDLVMGAYFLAALVVFAVSLRRLARSRLALGLLLLGGLLQGLALVADMKDITWMAEETLEVLGAASYLLAMAQYLIVELAGPSLTA